MEQMGNLLPKSQSLASSCNWDQRQLELMNSQKIESDLYNCPTCGNKGVIFRRTESGEIVATPCKCRKTRESIRLMKRSGLEQSIRGQTFESYHAAEPWQRNILDKARSYADHPEGWFFIGGQVGCGKTHLCTAIVRQLLLEGRSAKYFPWREVSWLKGLHGNDLTEALDALKNVSVLYLDDFFKGGTMAADGKIKPSAADLNIAFEIINHRYINRDLITIFSSEKSIDEIMDLDEAVGSRIYQRTKGNYLYISPDSKKNYRMGGAL